MFTRILVPLDGSPFAEWALPTAVAIARSTGAAVRLVSVVEKPEILSFSEEPDPERDLARSYLLSAMSRIAPLCPGKVDVAVRAGRPVPEIEAEAGEWDASIVVMSTHGRAGLARLWKGSVAARCVEGGSCPVLLVRPPENAAADPGQVPFVARVVVPLDGSVVAERALEHAVSLAHAFRVHVLLLSVRSGGAATDDAPEPEPADKDDPTRAAALAYLRAQVARLRQSGVHSYGMILSEPDAAATIADRVKGDLLVMATNGHERLGRMLFGTVTDRVVRSASCSVIVIPPSREETAAARSA